VKAFFELHYEIYCSNVTRWTKTGDTIQSAKSNCRFTSSEPLFRAMLTMVSHPVLRSATFLFLLLTCRWWTASSFSSSRGWLHPNTRTLTRTSSAGRSGILKPLHFITQGHESRVFQLEEMEGQHSCLTELILHDSGDVTIEKTEGPTPSDSHGSWYADGDTQRFAMSVVKTFGGGREGTDLGTFEYSVKREFVGEISKVGDNLAVSGSVRVVIDEDSGMDAEVGYFSLIDTTNEMDWVANTA